MPDKMITTVIDRERIIQNHFFISPRYFSAKVNIFLKIYKNSNILILITGLSDTFNFQQEFIPAYIGNKVVHGYVIKIPVTNFFYQNTIR